MFNLTDMLLGQNNDSGYASQQLKKKGFSGTPTSAGPLAFNLSQGREDDRQAALGGLSNSTGQLIKLLMYLKGIGAFKGSAFESINNPMQPQMPMQDWKGAHDERAQDYSQPDPLNDLISNMKPRYY